MKLLETVFLGFLGALLFEGKDLGETRLNTLEGLHSEWPHVIFMIFMSS